ncbi:hypothetical protein ACFPOI_25595 [Nonomuraea angiospora]|uniref:Uncharacterized protein n=1 Tax=Nonomuraea angiospora TaxID=46172 RepID=A0ABR9LP92_9ACTN|nr:hypothetical protein [Nonomuraea angiospora]MBE1582468.1 hypothetical protein [Nonomuraea angiospora]
MNRVLVGLAAALALAAGGVLVAVSPAVAAGSESGNGAVPRTVTGDESDSVRITGETPAP